MKLVGSAEQQVRHPIFDASGVIASGGTAQLLLPERKSTSMLVIQNLSSVVLTLEFGSARATCTISGGVVNGTTVTNAGIGFSVAPIIEFIGGGGNVNFSTGPSAPSSFNSSFIGVNAAGAPGYPSPSGPGPNLTIGRPAIAHCVMTGSAPNMTVASIVIDDAGAGYISAPMVFIRNSLLDPNGCAVPSATVGLQLPVTGGSYYVNGTACPTDPIAIFGANTNQAFMCKWMT